MRIEKSALLALVVSDLLGAGIALSAEEQDVLKKVLHDVPVVAEMENAEEIENFIAKNYEELNPETIDALERLATKIKVGAIDIEEIADFGDIGRVALQHDN